MSETLVRDKIFVSYSHKDSWWLEEFKRMMTPQVRSGKLLIWSDTSIPTGSHWREEIIKALSESRVAVLAVSDHFMHSDFIHKIELPSLLLAAQEDGVRICWCLLSACIFEDTTIGSLQAAHDISKSFDKMRPAQRKETLKSVAKSVMSLYENISPSISWQENEASGTSDNAHSRKSQTSVLTATDVAIVELKINRDFDDFSRKDQECLLQGLAQILKVSDAEIRIRNKRRGCVIVNLELSTVLAEKLLIAAREGKLERLGIIKANLTNQGSNVEIESRFTTSTSHHHAPVMKLKQQINSAKDLQRNSRIVIEKVKDISFGKKFKKLINKNQIGSTLGLHSDLQVCILSLIDCYKCYMYVDATSPTILSKRLGSLIKSLVVLNDQIDVCLNFNKPLERRYIATALRSHTRFFKVATKNLSSRECDSVWQKFVLSSIAVWNNNWNG
jgi:hypothetical protein